MSTQFFLRDTGADVSTPIGTTGKALAKTRGPSLVTATADTVTGPTSGVELTDSPGGSLLEWYSPQLQGFVLSGLILMNFRMKESAAAANVGAQVEIFRCDANGNVISQVLNSEKGTELGAVTFTAQTWTATPTATTFQTGDRLKVVVFGNDAGGTMASGQTFGMTYDGPTSGQSGDSYVLFGENISLMVSAHRLPSMGAGN